MKYRILGKTDFKVSELSLGTCQLGGKCCGFRNVRTYTGPDAEDKGSL